MLPAKPVFSVRGVRELEFETIDWSSAKYVAWLKRGFALLADDAQASKWTIAFEPLAFRSEDSMFGQLAVAFSQAQRAGCAWPDKLYQALYDYLDAFRPQDARDLAHLIEMWRCVAALGGASRSSSLALKLMKSISPELAATARPAVATLVGAMTNSVAASGAPAPAIIAFFRFVRARPHLWSDHLIVALVDIELSHKGTPVEKNWRALRSDFGDQLRGAATAGSPVARALTRSLARHLKPDFNVRNASDQALQDFFEGIGMFAPLPEDEGGVQVPRSRSRTEVKRQLELAE